MNKYGFHVSLGDQDWFTNIGFEVRVYILQSQPFKCPFSGTEPFLQTSMSVQRSGFCAVLEVSNQKESIFFEKRFYLKGLHGKMYLKNTITVINPFTSFTSKESYFYRYLLLPSHLSFIGMAVVLLEKSVIEFYSLQGWSKTS